MNLLSQQTINIATGKFGDLFDTESRLITIFKEPIKIINTGVINSNPNPLYGYGDAAIDTNEITYQPISGIFPAIIIHKERLELGTSIAESTKTKMAISQNFIKVKSEAKDFIENGGKVESILVDGKTWKLGDSRHTQYFYGLTYFYYQIQETN